MPFTTPLRIAATCAVVTLGVTACSSGSGTTKPAAAPTTAPSAGSTAATSAAPSASPSPTGPDLSTMTGDQIFQQAVTALKGASSLQTVINGTTSGVPIQAHVSVDAKGDCTGSVNMGPGGSTDVLSTPQQTYLRPDATMLTTFWKGRGAAAAKLLNGRWMSGGQNDTDLKDIADSCSLKQYTDQLALAAEVGGQGQRRQRHGHVQRV